MCNFTKYFLFLALICNVGCFSIQKRPFYDNETSVVTMKSTDPVSICENYVYTNVDGHLNGKLFFIDTEREISYFPLIGEETTEAGVYDLQVGRGNKSITLTLENLGLIVKFTYKHKDTGVIDTRACGIDRRSLPVIVTHAEKKDLDTYCQDANMKSLDPTSCNS